MSDTRQWVHEAQRHVGTAQLVVDEVGRGLATVERAEVVAERAVPVLRTAVLVALGCVVGAGLYVVVVRWRARRTVTGAPPPEEERPAVP